MKEVQLQSTTRQGHVRNHVSYAAAVLSSAETPDKTKATIKTETDVKTEASLTAVTPDTVASSTVTTNDSIACAAPDKEGESSDTPPDPDKIDFDDEDEESMYAHDEDNLKTRIVTKTVHNEETGATKTIRKVERIQYSSKPPVKGSLTKHGFTINGEGAVGELAFYVSKIITKTDPKRKDASLTIKIDSMIAYCPVKDDPQQQQVACEIFDSDIMFLNLKEVEDDDPEPKYEVFGEKEPLCYDLADITKEFTINNNCKDCYHDCCDEYRFGEYCVVAVERYWKENKYTATLKEAYVHYIANYNRALDWHSYGENPRKLRKTQITKAPYCMRKGSLKHAIGWIKWNIEHGPHKEWYNTQRETRKRDRIIRETERITRNEFKQRKVTYRYGV